ncbi:MULTISPECIES: FAD-binding oxidoreductase [unclassified Crossiella]|uniref:FAD-binding oxidoreductase n=1 Tax=unclassified Crossiella TaxID=2620835 RepID=UPI0020002E59|nr:MULTISPECIES: FAD-binding protein [unclassified Crossiella]MCK2239011.1 FAD-binding protein [Crossiella sp. S99.2]MCK2251420.1 FAD-binding protein [Crossiella sp. S99.1]
MASRTNPPEGAGVSRRGLLVGAGAVAVTALGAGAVSAQAAGTAADFGPVTVRPGDLRYENLLRGNNFRFVNSPDEIRVVASTEQVVRAVGEAVRAGKRVAVRSGGHCFENLTADPAVRVLLDLSPMDEVTYDPARRAFSVQPGATLGQVYRRLLTGWGVTIPGGGCPEVGAGGHFAGGGYGPLSRRYGSVVDHLYAVEVVVVDKDGTARAVVATREPDDPNRDLWWAHTGGGGGNFGVVTRFWLRSPGATGTDPAKLLPASPQQMRQHVLIWPWAAMTERQLTGLLRNFGRWHERNSAPGRPQNGLYGVLQAGHKASGSVLLAVQADADLPGVDAMMTELITAVTAGLDLPTPLVDLRRSLPWLHRMTWPGSGEPGDVIVRRYKIKAGYLRRSFTESQLATIHRHLINDSGGPHAGMLLISYGGQANAVAPGATAIAQRDVIMKAVYQTIWRDDTEDKANLKWVREFYRDVYIETGGVPVPGPVNDGSYINYADADLADPVWNTSGVSAQTLYYKDNYPRLRRIKAKWDPRNVFRHSLSVEAG